MEFHKGIMESEEKEIGICHFHFYAFDGFVIYTFECEDSDFKEKILNVIEFSSYRWAA